MRFTHYGGLSATRDGFGVRIGGNDIQVINGHGQLLTGGGVGGGLGTSFYVDGNAGVDTYDGLSWAKAVKTIAKGIELVDNDIAVHDHWDRHNSLYINGGTYTEDLVRIPEKTDIIGVGSTDWRTKARIEGHCIPATAMNGCRFINMCFYVATAHPAFTAIASCHGISFINCDFETNASGTYGISITSCADYHIEGCRFYNVGGGRGFTAGIILLGSGANYNGRILNNWFFTGIGIDIDVGGLGTLIADNYFHCTTFGIDDEAKLATIINNRIVSVDVIANAWDWTELESAGNIVTGSDDAHNVPDVTVG